MRFASKFREWVLNDINATSVEDPLAAGGDAQQSSGQIQMDATGLEALGYLAYETVGAITEMALVARQDADPSNKLDPVHRVMAPVAYNSTYPMVQVWFRRVTLQKFNIGPSYPYYGENYNSA